MQSPEIKDNLRTWNKWDDGQGNTNYNNTCYQHALWCFLSPIWGCPRSQRTLARTSGGRWGMRPPPEDNLCGPSTSGRIAPPALRASSRASLLSWAHWQSLRDPWLGRRTLDTSGWSVGFRQQSGPLQPLRAGGTPAVRRSLGCTLRG